MVPWRLQPQYAGKRGRDQSEKHSRIGENKHGQERSNSAEVANRPANVVEETGSGNSSDGKGCRSDCTVHGPLTHEEELSSLGYQTFQRYYNVFRKGELGALVRTATPTMNIVEEYYDHENWCVLVEKA